MIRLDIQEYCNGCTKFDPTTDMTYIHINNLPVASDTTVYCTNRSKCEIIAGHIKQKLAEEKKNDQD